MGSSVSGKAGQLAISLFQVAAAWSISSIGYFWIVDALGLEVGYNDAPFLFTGYYAAFSLGALMVLKPGIRDFVRARRVPSEVFLIPSMAIIFASFALLVLPNLPDINTRLVGADEDLVAATSAYFLPKSTEILFQQMLLIAIVIALTEFGLSFRQVTLTVALLFGGFHLTLALDGYNGFYVLRYTVAATIFGLIAPYLILRVQGGFLAAYATHWGFYAVDATIGHFVLSGGL